MEICTLKIMARATLISRLFTMDAMANCLLGPDRAQVYRFQREPATDRKATLRSEAELVAMEVCRR